MIFRAINSVLSQKFDNWELIIVDDGSTDNTDVLINEIIGNYSNRTISYYYIEHQERSAARNFGVSVARGRFICFLDSDDYFLDTHLSVLKSHIDIEDQVYVTQSFVSELDGEKTRREIVHWDAETFSSTLWGLDVFPICCLCIPRSLLIENSFDIRYYSWEDFHLWFRLAENTEWRSIHEYTAVECNHANRSHNSNLANLNIEVIENRIDCISDAFSKVKYLQALGEEPRDKFIFCELIFWTNLAYVQGDACKMSALLSKMKTVTTDNRDRLIRLRKSMRLLQLKFSGK